MVTPPSTPILGTPGILAFAELQMMCILEAICQSAESGRDIVLSPGGVILKPDSFGYLPYAPSRFIIDA